MVIVERLEKSYGKHQILRGLTFRVRPGSITGIAGPNACGKSTLVKCLLGLTVPSSGRIEIGGQNVAGAWAYRSKIGYVPQTPEFPSTSTPAELMKMLEELRGLRAHRVAELIEYFSLGPFLHAPFGTLSGGTRQKVAAVIALMFDASFLVLDEPSAGLDPVSSVRFKDLLAREARAGKAIILVSHVMSEMDQLATELIYLGEGKVVFKGSIRKLKERAGESELERAITQLMIRENRIEEARG
jgi:Cu-processing system ATP-binding protein